MLVLNRVQKLFICYQGSVFTIMMMRLGKIASRTYAKFGDLRYNYMILLKLISNSYKGIDIDKIIEQARTKRTIVKALDFTKDNVMQHVVYAEMDITFLKGDNGEMREKLKGLQEMYFSLNTAYLYATNDLNLRKIMEKFERQGRLACGIKRGVSRLDTWKTMLNSKQSPYNLFLNSSDEIEATAVVACKFYENLSAKIPSSFPSELRLILLREIFTAQERKFITTLCEASYVRFKFISKDDIEDSETVEPFKP